MWRESVLIIAPSHAVGYSLIENLVLGEKTGLIHDLDLAATTCENIEYPRTDQAACI
jgi:hypothetical protein